MLDFLVAVAPSAGVFFIFVIAVRAMLQADRRERRAESALRGEAPPGVAEPPAPGADGPPAAESGDGPSRG